MTCRPRTQSSWARVLVIESNTMRGMDSSYRHQNSNGRRPFSTTPVDLLLWVCQEVRQLMDWRERWLSFRSIWLVHRQQAKDKPGQHTVDHLTKETRPERARSRRDLQRARHDRCQHQLQLFQEQHCGKSSRTGGAHMGFPERAGATLNWTELVNKRYARSFPHYVVLYVSSASFGTYLGHSGIFYDQIWTCLTLKYLKNIPHPKWPKNACRYYSW